MLHFARWQIYLILGVCFFGIMFALPNVLPESVRNSLPSFIPHQPVPLGLDLRGGAYMLLEADVDSAIKDRTNTVLDDARQALRNGRILYSGLAVAPSNDALSVRIIDPAKTPDAVALLKKLVQPSG